MTYTSHGQHIPGTPDELYKPAEVYDCGGPRVCMTCHREAAIQLHPSNTTTIRKEN